MIAANHSPLSHLAIRRLLRYRRVLTEAYKQGTATVFSHQIASMCGRNNAYGGSAQVRRDLMHLGCEGKPNSGYNIESVLSELETFLAPDITSTALIGVGHLGKALLRHFTQEHAGFSVVAAFDCDPEKIDRVISGCHIFSLDRFAIVAQEMNITQIMLAVPSSVSQQVVDQTSGCGVKSIVNFTSLPLSVPSGVFVENVDLIASVEVAAFLGKQIQLSRGAP